MLTKKLSLKLEVEDCMYNKKGMILIEALLLFMICVVLVAIVSSCAQARLQMEHMEERGFDDASFHELFK